MMGHGYLGKAREEFNRRMRDAAAPVTMKDPVQVYNLFNVPLAD